MNRANPCPPVGGDRGGVEGGVFDVVAHRGHVVVAHRLHVHQRAAVVEDELPVILVEDRVPEVHELRWCADVELQAFEHVRHAVAVDLQSGSHPPGVDRTRGHPLLDRDLRHGLAAESRYAVRHSGPVDQLAGQQ